jgi:4-amino-4-deoxy-L-arabinose transferase-like glycosyltransferase
MSKYLWLLDLFWCLGLAVYVLAGVPLAVFHGDEAMLIYLSRDYQTAFIEHNPGQLTTEPPYTVDSDPHLRILNGSIAPYTIGFSRHLFGKLDDKLTGLWQWGASYEDNARAGYRPLDDVLTASRWPAAVFFCGSIAVMFAMGWLYGGRITAYSTSLLYTLHPILLLYGRRAMHEGALLFFGLLLVLAALLIANGLRRWQVWPALALLGGLTLASKHSGILYLGIAWGILGVTLFWERSWRGYILLFLAGAASILIFVILSPALWNNPPARTGNLLEVRGDLLEMQVAGQPTPLIDRIKGIITQPYIEDIQYYEVGFWGDSPEIRQEVQDYESSPLSGLPRGILIGAVTMLAACFGLFELLKVRRPLGIGLLIWLGLVIASLLVNPLPWQRYAMPLFPVTSLLVGISIAGLYHRISALKKAF